MSRSIEKSGSQSGAVALEFAIVVPILAIIMFAMFDLSRLVLIQQMAQSATREASRHLARSPLACSEGGGSSPQSAAIIQSTKLQFERLGLDPFDIDVQVDIECRPISNETSMGMYEASSFMPVIRVTVSLAYRTMFEAIAGLDGQEISSSHQQVWTG